MGTKRRLLVHILVQTNIWCMCLDVFKEVCICHERTLPSFNFHQVGDFLSKSDLSEWRIICFTRDWLRQKTSNSHLFANLILPLKPTWLILMDPELICGAFQHTFATSNLTDCPSMYLIEAPSGLDRFTLCTFNRVDFSRPYFSLSSTLDLCQKVKLYILRSTTSSFSDFHSAHPQSVTQCSLKINTTWSPRDHSEYTQRTLMLSN